ncbi:hypothetical protein BKA64DRAFT_719186 [Cadophora sp. MPI-SDFR-AT-0126]|nr:hypothetical protein BKA64DRAFT_719186 [Leotiomycetes sp. MPI-SDFR-AT-0126]
MDGGHVFRSVDLKYLAVAETRHADSRATDLSGEGWAIVPQNNEPDLGPTCRTAVKPQAEKPCKIVLLVTTTSNSRQFVEVFQKIYARVLQFYEDMDAPWHQTWPEMGELHVFDPEGDVLLILERYQEDDLEEQGSETYPEGRTLRDQGHLIIPLPNKDPDAIIILLNIIHRLSSKVPRQVDLNMLSKIAIAVNHRQMHETVGMWTDTWIENLKRDEGLLSSYTPDALLSWLFIFWVFREAEGFRNILENEVETTYIGPHIPASIICNIQKHRIDLIESMIAVIHDLITKYSGPDILCDYSTGFSCDANLLGSLLKASAIIGIWPHPEDPYLGINSKMLASQIREMNVLDDCRRPGKGYYNSGGCHQIKALVEASMESLEDRIPGLRLASFLPKASKKDKKGRQRRVDCEV